MNKQIPDFLEPIASVAGVRVDFIPRIPEVDVDGERDEVLQRLRPHHEAWVNRVFSTDHWWEAEQVHGAEVAVIPQDDRVMIPGVDGLITNSPGEVLGIYVADCGPLWLVDRKTGAIGCLHSGKKGTEANIMAAGVAAMSQNFGTDAADLVVVLGPCIRPPHYEIDIAGQMAKQAEELEVGEYHDCGIDTASDLDNYYSYRMEKGRTGRMLALIMRE